MDSVWREGELEFDFSGALQPIEIPDKDSKGLKSVDFIAKYPQELWLIEVKDPEATPSKRREGEIKGTLEKIRNESLMNEHILPKLYGTFAHLVQKRREPRGRVRYGIVFGLTSLTAAERSTLTDKSQRIVDRIGPKIRHSRNWPIIEIHNIESWNAAHPEMTVTRKPEVPTSTDE